MISDGILVLNKPQNWTSHDCVAICRRVLRLKGIKKIGHGGTLDPMAEGVLPIFIGQATRIMEYLELDYKKYTCELQLGITTDTQDIWGEVLSRKTFEGITEEQVLRELDGFRGVISQMPPLYSAVRVDGKRLYDLAHKGRSKAAKKAALGTDSVDKAVLETDTVDRAVNKADAAIRAANKADAAIKAALEKVEPRRVHIRLLEVHEIDLEKGRISFSAECSKGTYIRTICADLGDRLSCGAALTALQRTAIGSFGLEGSVSPEEIKRLGEVSGDGALQLEQLLLPPDAPLSRFGEITMPADRAHYFRQGNSIRLHQVRKVRLPEIEPDPFEGKIPCNARGRRYDRIYRVYQQENGLFLGTGYLDEEHRVLKADKVFMALNEPKKKK